MRDVLRSISGFFVVVALSSTVICGICWLAAFPEDKPVWAVICSYSFGSTVLWGILWMLIEIADELTKANLRERPANHLLAEVKESGEVSQ